MGRLVAPRQPLQDMGNGLGLKGDVLDTETLTANRRALHPIAPSAPAPHVRQVRCVRPRSTRCASRAPRPRPGHRHCLSAPDQRQVKGKALHQAMERLTRKMQARKSDQARDHEGQRRIGASPARDHHQHPRGDRADSAEQVAHYMQERRVHVQVRRTARKHPSDRHIEQQSRAGDAASPVTSRGSLSRAAAWAEILPTTASMNAALTRAATSWARARNRGDPISISPSQANRLGWDGLVLDQAAALLCAMLQKRTQAR